MLPEQQDILWTFVTFLFTLFSVYVFANVLQQCRTHKHANLKAWGSVFLVGIIVNVLMTAHMLTLTQQEQLQFVGWQVLAVLATLLVWGLFFKSSNIETQSPPFIRAAFFYLTISILLAGYTNWLPQQRSDPPKPIIDTFEPGIGLEEYADMGRIIVFGAKPAETGRKSIGKGQCPLCHTFDPGDNIGRCPNLFGVEERSHARIKEDRYLNEPIKIGETDGASGIVKGQPDQIPSEFRRADATELTGEDYLRESLLCPSCYVVEGYGKAGDKVSPMPIISKPPISLSPIELNAVVAWLQYKDSRVVDVITVKLPTETPPGPGPGPVEPEVFVTGNEKTVAEMLDKLQCPMCHTIPGIPGATGQLGPVLHEKINAPKRLKDPNYKGTAKTPEEYTKESILNPSAYVVVDEKTGESYPDGLMPQDFSSKISVKGLNRIVEFISKTQPEKGS